MRVIRRRLLAVASILLGAAALAMATAIPVIGDGTRTPADSVAPASVGADGRIRMVVIAPITVPVGDGGLISSARLAKLTGPTGLLTQELNAVTGTSVTLAIDPRIIASIRVLGASAPATAESWLVRLADLDNETFPLAYADADPVAAGQAGRTIETAPQSFAFAIDSSDFGAAATASPSPSPTATAAPGRKPPLPQSANDVTAWNWKYSDIAWPAADTVVV